MTPTYLLDLAMGLTATAIWGPYAVVSRGAILEGFAPTDIVALRYAASALVLAPFAWQHRAAIAALGWRRLIALAIAAGAGNSLFYAGGLVYAPSSLGGTIPPITVAIVGTLLAIPMLKEVPTLGRVAALAVMACGVVLVGLDGLLVAHPGTWRGDLLLTCAGVTWATFTILMRAWQVPAIPATAEVTMLSAALIPFCR